MPQSLARVLIHIVFSTRDRRPWINDAIRSEMHAYIATGLSTSEHVAVRVGGVADHVHIALYLSRGETIAKLVERLKVSSSKWIKTKGPEFSRFAWQKGYAVFSIALGHRAALVRYIDEQAKHHQRRDYQAEMRAMFAQYDVAFDERVRLAVALTAGLQPAVATAP